MNRNGDYGIPVPDYVEENVSVKVVKIIQSYTDIVNRMVWEEKTGAEGEKIERKVIRKIMKMPAGEGSSFAGRHFLSYDKGRRQAAEADVRPFFYHNDDIVLKIVEETGRCKKT